MAVRAVKAKELTILQASKQFQVQRTRIYNHVRGRDKNAPKTYRNKPFHLTEVEEAALAQYCRVISQSGLPLRRIEVSKCALVNTIIYRVLLYF